MFKKLKENKKGFTLVELDRCTGNFWLSWQHCWYRH